jgi:2-dehydro-3-deoxygluconokinase
MTELLQGLDATAITEVATIGEALGVMTPVEPGRLRDVTSYEKDVGGAELNVAVALARLGHRSRWLGAVGDDEIGHQALASLRAAGVDADHARVIRDGRTGLYLKEQRTNGRLRVHYYRDDSVATRMAPSHLDISALTDARIVHLTGITACLQPYGAAIVEVALDAAHRSNRLVTFDVNLRRKLLNDRDAAELMRPALESAHVLVLSEEEADVFLGGRDEAALGKALAQLSSARLVVVHGSGGALAADEDGMWAADSYEAVPLDTVGAGDAFMAGLLSGILRGWPTRDALKLANACGACAVAVRGDARSMPYEDDALLLVHGPAEGER